MCGEKLGVALLALAFKGSPPHVRGKVLYGSLIGCTAQDHPRMCGEKLVCWPLVCTIWGSPPHVRGKDDGAPMLAPEIGITPACAGKRCHFTAYRGYTRDHPRMCGEKKVMSGAKDKRMGSPPHVRGKALRFASFGSALRITPACAGKRLKRSRSTVPPVAIVPLFPSVCNKPVASDGSPAGRDAPLFLPAENAVPASPAYNLRSL